MESSIFSYVIKYSWRQQLVILVLTLLSFPSLYYSLELPKIIINRALGRPTGPWQFMGHDFGQVHYLFVLCGMFLILVLISGALKYVINVYAGIVAERMLRRLRYQLYEHVLRFPLPHFRRVSQGELVQMINAETEALGGFVGDALAVPAFQGGTLLTILLFMFIQDPTLGLAAIALYPLQMYLIPKLQAKVNQLGKKRVQQVRRNAERISETASSIRDIHANDTSQFELARFSEQLGTVFWIRFDIYKKKFLIKFINNFISQLGPFFFFSIGGYLVIQGDITLGALVAVVGAHKDLASPWKELLSYYQTMFDVKIKYEQTVNQFAPPGLKPLALIAADPPADIELRGVLRASNLSIRDDSGEPLVDGVSFEARLPSHIAITGPAGCGRDELTQAIAGLLAPDSGRLTLNDRSVQELPESVLGRRMAYLTNPGAVLVGTIEDNLLYGLKHRPIAQAEDVAGERARIRKEALRAGNSPLDIIDEWVDWRATDDAGPPESRAVEVARMIRVLDIVQLSDDIYSFGLRGTLPTSREELADWLLQARRHMLERLGSDDRLARLVEPFDPDRYNTNATIAENLLFGLPIGETFNLDRLASHPHLRDVLERTGLVTELRKVGLQLARTMVELFTDLPPDHEYFQQFSFIAPEDLPEYRALLSRADPEHLERLGKQDGERLLSLPMRLSLARHRLGLVDDALQEKILEARREFRKKLPAHLHGAVAFFDPEHFNPAATIQENILFGKIAYGTAQANQKVAVLLGEIIEELGLRTTVTEVGLATACGIGGGRLSSAQRQKLVIARALIRRPEMLVLHEPLGALDSADQLRLRDRLLEEFEGKTVVWSLSNVDWSSKFARVLSMDHGRIAAQDDFAQIGHAVSAPETAS